MPEDETVDNMEGATTSETQDANTIASQDASDTSSVSDVDNAENPGDTNEDNKAPQSIKDAIAAAINGSEESDEESPPSVEDQEKKEAEKVAADTARLDKNPRFQEVIAERNLAQDELKEFEPIREVLKDSFLSSEDAVETLRIGNSINRALSGDIDPAEALNGLIPIVQALQNAAGLIMPADLQQAINEGKLSKDYAQQLAKERAANMLMANKAERLKKAQELKEVEETNKKINLVRQNVEKATTDWETKQRAIDPDYEPKRKLIYTAITAAVLARKQQGLLTTPEEAVAISNAVYKEVSDSLAVAYPKRQAVRPNNMSGGAPSSKVVVKPATRKDSIMAVLNGGS